MSDDAELDEQINVVRALMGAGSLTKARDLVERLEPDCNEAQRQQLATLKQLLQVQLEALGNAEVDETQKLNAKDLRRLLDEKKAEEKKADEGK